MPKAICKICNTEWHGWALKWGKEEYCCDKLLIIEEE